jgi:hypothetical protein
MVKPSWSCNRRLRHQRQNRDSRCERRFERPVAKVQYVNAPKEGAKSGSIKDNAPTRSASARRNKSGSLFAVPARSPDPRELYWDYFRNPLQNARAFVWGWSDQNYTAIPACALHKSARSCSSTAPAAICRGRNISRRCNYPTIF